MRFARIRLCLTQDRDAEVAAALIAQSDARPARGRDHLVGCGLVTYDVDRLRARIPALADGTAYFDGPGGTQTPDIVAAAIAGALMSGTVQPRAHDAGRAQRRRHHGRRAAGRRRPGQRRPRGIVFGRSMTELTFQVARTLAQGWGPGDEVVVTRLDHDGNVRPWVTYARAFGRNRALGGVRARAPASSRLTTCCPSSTTTRASSR